MFFSSPTTSCPVQWPLHHPKRLRFHGKFHLQCKLEPEPYPVSGPSKNVIVHDSCFFSSWNFWPTCCSSSFQCRLMSFCRPVSSYNLQIKRHYCIVLTSFTSSSGKSINARASVWSNTPSTVETRLSTYSYRNSGYPNDYKNRQGWFICKKICYYVLHSIPLGIQFYKCTCCWCKFPHWDM